MERATQERLVGATLLIVAGVILIPWLLDGSMTEPGVNQQELVLPGGSDNGNETRRISLEVPRQSGSVASPSGAGSLPASPPSGQSVSASGEPIQEVNARTVKGVDEPQTMTFPKPEPKPEQVSASKAPARFVKPMPESDKPPVQIAASEPAERIDPPVVQPKPKPVVQAATAPPKEAVRREPPAAKPAAASSPPAAAVAAWAVQVGSFASEDNAERLAARLRDKSYKAFVMRNVLDGRVLYRVRVGPVSERNQAELLATALREDRQPARILSHP